MSQFIKVDMSDVEDLENKFKLFAKKAYPFATKFTVNEAAFTARAVARNNIKRDFTLRNIHTRRGIQVDRATTLRVSRQEAAVGSLDDYMERQEFGGTIHSKGKHGKPLYTAVASGLPEKTSPITKLPTKANRLGARGKLSLSRKSTKPKNLSKSEAKQQRAAIAIKQALKSGRRHVFLEDGKSKGLFKIKGRGKKKTVQMVHDLSHEVVTTPASPWLRPAVDRVVKQLPRIYKKELIKQAQRHRLFGY